MQTNVKRAASCEGKEKFANFSLAEKIASKQAHRRGKKFQAYACTDCGGFHVGTAIGGSKERGGVIDPRKPYDVHARNHDGHVRLIGHSSSPEGTDIASLLAQDGWEITKISRVR